MINDRLEFAYLACLAAVTWLLPGSTECASSSGRSVGILVQSAAPVRSSELPKTSPRAESAAPAQAASLPGRPLTTSVLILTEGIRGGVIGPTHHFVAAFSYDWNRARYRAVVRGWRRAEPQREGPLHRAAELSEDEFRRVLDGVCDLGLADLPVERPAACQDVYGRDLGIELLHGEHSWHNRAPGGCVSARSAVQPSPVERERFDAVVAFLEERLSSLELLPASLLDEAVAVVEPLEAAEAFPLVVERLRSGDFAGLVDFNRVLCVPGRGRGAPTAIRFALHGRQHPASLAAQFWPEHVLVAVGADVQQVRPIGDVRSCEPIAEDSARRAAYLAAHSDLAAPLRELIERGWIDRDMTPEMVIAAWGEPEERHDLGVATTLTYEGGPTRRDAQLHFREGGLAHLPWRLHRPAR